MSAKYYYRILFWMAFFLSGCSQAETVLTSTISPSETIAPSATTTTTPTQTYIPITPVSEGTQIPEHGGVITSNNVDRLTLISQIGKGSPEDLVFTSDGEYLIIATGAGIHIYDSEDFSYIHYLDTGIAVFDIAVSSDNQALAVVAAGKVLVYEIGSWQPRLEIQGQANSADFSPDGSILALGIKSDPGSLLLHDAYTGEILQTFSDSAGAWGVKISPLGNLVATAGFATTTWALDGTIIDQNGPYVSGGHTASVSFSPDGEYLAEAYDYTVRVWRVLENMRKTNYREINLTDFEYPLIFDVAISPDGEKLAITLSTGIGVWELSTGSRIFFTAAESGFRSYYGIAWAMNNEVIGVATKENGVEIWDIKKKEQINSLHIPSGTYSALAWSPDGEKIGVGAVEGMAYILDAEKGSLLKRFGSGYRLNGLTFAPDNQSVALGYDDRSVQFWDLDGEILHTLVGFGFGGSEPTYNFDGSYFAAILRDDWQSPPQVQLWNTDSWTVENIYPIGNGDDFSITGFALTPDGKVGAITYVDRSGSGTHHEYIKIISISDGEEISLLDPINYEYRVMIKATAFSPDGNLFAALIFEFFDPHPRFLVWQTSDWSLVYEEIIFDGSRIGFTGNQHDALAWSTDSSLIAIGLEDGNIQVFKADNGELLKTLVGHHMWVSGVSFSPDGRILASVSIDGTLILWGLK